MKRFSITAAAVAALLAGSAHAQSTVTVFGVVDLAARSVKNNETQRRLDSSGLTSSRLGFRGVEDLGGGLRAGFWLEGALTADDGNAAGQNWQRRSTVSLSGNFGELRLGRDKTPSALNWDELDPFRDTGMGASTRLALAAGVVPTGGVYTNFTRANNLAAYFTPGATGFFAHGAVAAGEGVLGNKYAGLRAGYRDSNLLVSGSYGETEVSNTIDAKLWDVGASYDFKSFKLWGLYASLDMGPASQTNYLLGVSVPVGSFDFRASYQQMEGDEAINNREAKKFAVGGGYNLSRRTTLYGTVVRIDNTNTAFTVATGGPLSTGRNSTGYELGMRHTF